MEFSVIILAAGSGTRTGLNYNKILYEVNGKRVIDYSIESFRKYHLIKNIYLVVSKHDFSFFESEYSTLVDGIIIGGNERQESVALGLSNVTTNYVIIHDGARPFLPDSSMQSIFSTIKSQKSITLGVKVKDTIQEVIDNKVKKTLDRANLIRVQTPQAFWTEEIKKAHELAVTENFLGTDDTILMEKFLGVHAYVVEGDYRNIKLTTKEDIKFLEVIL